MKKTLITVLIILLLIVIVFMLLNSLHIGNLQILGLKELNNKNQKLDSSIQQLANLNSAAYQKAIKDVKDSSKEYEEAKKNYNDLVEISTSNEVVTANQLQKYEIEYLWAKIGKHATDEDVTLKIEVAENSTSASTGYYDLNFTAAGDYVGITDFIYDIENDSSLGFKIEKFKMQSIDSANINSSSTRGDGTGSSAATVSATFTCSNISINIDSSLVVKSEKNETKEKNDVEDKNNTESSNSTNDDGASSNTTNTTNTTNSQTNTNTTR